MVLVGPEIRLPPVIRYVETAYINTEIKNKLILLEYLGYYVGLNRLPNLFVAEIIKSLQLQQLTRVITYREIFFTLESSAILRHDVDIRGPEHELFVER